ncbi:MAG: P-loop NTPase [Myxococcota bacterium]|jgi:flagellar biosynthesis protein FlhG
MRKPILAFGGGKGGVGKSFLSTNVSIHLARTGLKVAVIDCDLGGANLHTFLGMNLPKVTLSDYISHKIPTLAEALVGSPYENLWLGTGVLRDLTAVNFKHTQKMRLIRAIRDLDFDVTVLDLGAGTSFNVLDFFGQADLGVLVTLPEPTAVENCYRFLKSSFFRYLRHDEKDERLKALLDEAMTGEGPIRGPFELVKAAEAVSMDAAHRYSEELNVFRPGLIINQVRSQDDRALSGVISSALKRFYGFHVRPLGEISYDDSIWRSIRQRAPLMATSAESIASRDTGAACRAIAALVTELRTIR